MLFEKTGDELQADDLREALTAALAEFGKKHKVLVLPPDITRLHSRAGELTRYAYDYFGDAVSDILPALGTHAPMTAAEIDEMFGAVPHDLFRPHDWRNDVVTLGEVPAEFVSEVSGGNVDYTWPAQVNKLLRDGGHDLILSIGQVVPHEVAGMANYNKNIFVGTGGAEGINKSHFIGAVCDMEKIMGRADNPVRKVLNYATKNFSADLPTIVYVHTVIGMADDGSLKTRGLFIGDDIECFTRAADLAVKVNMTLLEKPLEKVVVYLDPKEFRSTWLGNKSIYRTRMALADDGELIVLAPGVETFGEDPEIDRLIRRYGYRGTPETLANVAAHDELRNNLSAAAHLVHGSSEGRFSITYCPGGLTRAQVEGVNFNYAKLDDMIGKYDPAALRDGFNSVDGEEIFYISNPGLGLWALAGSGLTT